MDEHRGEGEGKYSNPAPPPQANFKTLVKKNAIKHEIGGPPCQFFLKALTPLGILAKTSGTPSPGFSTHVHLCIFILYFFETLVILLFDHLHIIFFK
jgi:hypothetical protein